jgi:hypothetical protein
MAWSQAISSVIFKGKKQKARKVMNLRGLVRGAGSRNRTGTISQSADFESAASTNFATPAV